MATETVRLKDIVRDPRLQLRVKGLDKHHVSELVDALKSGKKLGAIKACRKGKKVFPYDGWHRIAAHEQAEKETIDASLDDGDIEQAVLLAAGANTAHGLKRTNDDKRASVKAVLDHETGKDWSDRRIADHVGVGDKLVAEIRAQLRETAVENCENPVKIEETRVGKDGKRRKVTKPKKPENTTTPHVDVSTSTNGFHHATSEEPSDNPFPAEAERMLHASHQLSQLAGKVKEVAEEVSKFTGEGFATLVAKDNIDIALANIIDNLKVHAHTLRASAPSCMCLDCNGRGCIFCQHRRYQTSGERKEAESRRTAKTGSRKTTGAVA